MYLKCSSEVFTSSHHSQNHLCAGVGAAYNINGAGERSIVHPSAWVPYLTANAVWPWSNMHRKQEAMSAEAPSLPALKGQNWADRSSQQAATLEIG